MTVDAGDLGFSFRTIKTGDVAIRRGSLVITRLRGAAARKFLSQMAGLPASGQQQVMARVTGNYKRGNEQRVARHPRNRARDRIDARTSDGGNLGGQALPT